MSPPRKFAPTPFETTYKSSRQPTQPKEDSPKPRRFVPEVIETTKSSSRRTYTPEPIETSRYSSRKSSAQQDDDSSSSSGKTVRKFNPELIDTSQRSRRGSASQDGGLDELKDKISRYDYAHKHESHDGTPKAVSIHEGDIVNIQLPTSERRRVPAPLDGTRPAHLSFAPERQHSFRCPDLDTIESSESERGSAGPSSRSSSLDQHSPNTASDSSFTDLYKHATRIRESVDGNFSQYLLRLEAKKAEEKLRDQALAAFPNSDYHEPVQHFVNNDSDSDEMEIEDRPVTWDAFDEDELIERITRHRQESVKIPWEQLELQRAAEKRALERKANGESSQHPLWWTAGNQADTYNQENEIRSMRDRARPPMLGTELVFVRCPSPEPARFDITQAPAVVKRMCQQSSSAVSEEKKSNDGGLWCAAPKVTPPSPPQPACWLTATSPTKPAGLWGGFCADDTDALSSAGLLPPTGQTGLMTPRRESSGQVNPFDQTFAAATTTSIPVPPTPHMLRTPGSPPTPPESVSNLDLGSMSGTNGVINNPAGVRQLDAILAADQALDAQIAAEFPDTFVTQVFNYLSLGYPSLARAYDLELSKIARVPVADLRLDDARAKLDVRGYIRLGPDFEPAVEGQDEIKGEDCVRWRALRTYIHEWARQEKNMVRGDEIGGTWGTTTARRGSWGN